MKRFLENVGTGFGLLLGMLSTCCMILFPRTRVYGGDGETNMTELLQTILLRVTIAGAVSAMALKLAGGRALKEVVRTAAGLLHAAGAPAAAGRTVMCCRGTGRGASRRAT